MSDLPEERIKSTARSDWLLLEYDYFKHLSTIALVTIGAFLTWIQGNKPATTTTVMIALSLVAISATLCFGAMNHIIVHRKTGKRLRTLFGWERGIAGGTFAIGLGLFMSEIRRTIP